MTPKDIRAAYDRWANDLSRNIAHENELMKPTYFPKIGVDTTNKFPNILPPMSEAMLMKLLTMRLRIGEGERIPFNHLSIYASNNKAIVFVVGKDEKPLTLEDDPDLFPSDVLITQLRLLMG